MKELQVDGSKCVKCRTCTHVCFTNVIEWDEKLDRPVGRYREDCVLCLICQAYCPKEALTVVPDWSMKHNPPALAEEGQE